MGAVSSHGGPEHVDSYPIRLTAEQSVGLHGFSRAKGTLTWKDFKMRSSRRSDSRGKITFSRCVALGVPVHKLYAMQPDLRQWIAHAEVTVADCVDMRLWSPNPFLHFDCKLGDLIVHRNVVPPEVLIRTGVTVTDMCDRYGLDGELMAMLHYAPEDWIALGLAAGHLGMLSDAQWARVFGQQQRGEVALRLPA
jgi:hypothetical protein